MITKTKKPTKTIKLSQILPIDPTDKKGLQIYLKFLSAVANSQYYFESFEYKNKTHCLEVSTFHGKEVIRLLKFDYKKATVEHYKGSIKGVFTFDSITTF